jgi:Protein of unknown function (DUF2909)
MEFKFFVIAMLVLILLSLGNALFHLSSKKGDSRKMVKALSWRIGLSVLLFLILILGYYGGWVHPAVLR